MELSHDSDRLVGADFGRIFLGQFRESHEDGQIGFDSAHDAGFLDLDDDPFAAAQAC